MINLNKYKKECEREVEAVALTRNKPMLFPLFSIMDAHIEESYQSMSVSDFVDMCISIGEIVGDVDTYEKAA